MQREDTVESITVTPAIVLLMAVASGVLALVTIGVAAHIQSRGTLLEAPMIDTESDQTLQNSLDDSDFNRHLAWLDAIEKLITSEVNWITTRMNWLLVSQSFLLAGQAVLVTSQPGSRELDWWLLYIGIPLLGFWASYAAGRAVRAAASVADQLCERRVEVTDYLNRAMPGKMRIPRLGTLEIGGEVQRDRNISWTAGRGALPHKTLPWAFATLWIILLIVPMLNRFTQWLSK